MAFAAGIEIYLDISNGRKQIRGTAKSHSVAEWLRRRIDAVPCCKKKQPEAFGRIASFNAKAHLNQKHRSSERFENSLPALDGSTEEQQIGCASDWNAIVL
jgi:hypothetical protein